MTSFAIPPHLLKARIPMRAFVPSGTPGPDASGKSALAASRQRQAADRGTIEMNGRAQFRVAAVLCWTSGAVAVVWKVSEAREKSRSLPRSRRLRSNWPGAAQRNNVGSGNGVNNGEINIEGDFGSVREVLQSRQTLQVIRT